MTTVRGRNGGSFVTVKQQSPQNILAGALSFGPATGNPPTLTGDGSSPPGGGVSAMASLFDPALLSLAAGLAAAGAGILVGWLLPRSYAAGILALGAAAGAALAPWPGRLDGPEVLLIATALLAVAALGALASPASMRRTYGGAPTQGQASRE